MKPITQEWIRRAEGNWASAGRALRDRKTPTYDHTCFFAHECAEQYLKARLQEANQPFPKTHDLPYLLSLVLPVEPTWEALKPSLLWLNDFGLDILYPGRWASRADAQRASKLCRQVRETIRQSLGLPV